MFALELGVEHSFRPVFDITSLEAAEYADNPALKIPILVDEGGPLFGSDNVCRELSRRAASRGSMLAKSVLRGEVRARVVENAEELTSHVMSCEVNLIMAKMGGVALPPKVLRSVEGCLDWLDANLDAVLGALPSDRTVSFVEVAVFCVVTHLPFRDVMDVSPWPRLVAFARTFGQRESARATEYRFDRAAS